MTVLQPSGPHVVAVGGGHGLAMTLRAVVQYAGRVTAVVSTADDGGSSGRIRRDLGMPAPGDLRRCITSVAPDRGLAAAFEHRFSTGELAGHAVGNLVLAGLVDAGVDLIDAARLFSGWVGIDDAITFLPATSEPVELVATTAAGTIRGQVEVERSEDLLGVSLDPPGPAVPARALDDLARADQIILGPGSFYASVIAAALPPAIRDAVDARRGTLVWIANLRADEPGVRGLDVADHLRILARHGVEPDVVVVQEAAVPLGAVPAGPRILMADIDRPHGLAHDSDLLAALLAQLM